jgi:ABC-type multidrug transport system permease subunit
MHPTFTPSLGESLFWTILYVCPRLSAESRRIQSSQRQGIILLFCIQFFVYASTFSQMIIAALPDAETAGIIATLMFAMCVIFNG